MGGSSKTPLHHVSKSPSAGDISLENPAASVKYQGVVNSLMDTFGYIERADVVKEIFFHTSKGIDGKEEDNSHIQLGDNVEFIIQTRNGKEVATNLVKLPLGTVVFEDVGTEYFTGQVLKPLDRNGKYQQTEPLQGRVKYTGLDRSEVESSFGEKDQLGDFTLRHGDWIMFVIATDRRDKLKRATKIELLDESFKVSDERREQGVIQACKEGFGFLKCVERSEKMFFHFSECLEVNRKLMVGDEMEFTVAPDPTTLGRQLATRIKHLPPGTVKFDNVIAQNILGSEENMMSAGSGSPPSAVLDDCQNNNLEDMDVNDLDMNLINVDIYDYMDHFKNKNTKRNEDCAINAFDRTMEKINKIKGTKFKSFKDASEEELSEQICEYFKVAKKRNGQYYNAASLTTLMGSFSRVLRNRRVNPIETKDNPKFNQVHRFLTLRETDMARKGKLIKSILLAFHNLQK